MMNNNISIPKFVYPSAHNFPSSSFKKGFLKHSNYLFANENSVKQDYELLSNDDLIFINRTKAALKRVEDNDNLEWLSIDDFFEELEKW